MKRPGVGLLVVCAAFVPVGAAANAVPRCLQPLIAALTREKKVKTPPAVERLRLALLGEDPDIWNHYSIDEIDDAIALHLKGEGLNIDSSTLSEKLKPLLDFRRLTKSEAPLAELGPRIQEFIRSEDHALFFYRNIEDFGSRADEAFEFVLNESEYFTGAVVLPGVSPRTLLTFSFEKESHNPLLTDFYKPVGFKDEDWFALEHKMRDEKLRECLPRCEATGLKPQELGRKVEKERAMRIYSGEGYNRGKAPLEVKHRNFEFDLDRLVGQVSELFHKLKEKDAIHLHEVFELPKKYAHMDKFNTWFKRLNDYLYVAGLEEGLHSTRLTGIPAAEGLPKTVEAITRLGSKFFSAGLRAKIYGEAKSPNFVRVGIELRDVTRDLDKLKVLAKRLGKAIQSKIWDRFDDHEAKTLVAIGNAAWSGDADIDRVLIAAGLTAKQAKALRVVEPKIKIPLSRFELFPSIARGPPSAEVVQRIAEARATYLDEIGKLARELVDLRRRKEKVDDDLLRTAIRYTMTDWAKRARVSEILEPDVF